MLAKVALHNFTMYSEVLHAEFVLSMRQCRVSFTLSAECSLSMACSQCRTQRFLCTAQTRNKCIVLLIYTGS